MGDAASDVSFHPYAGVLAVGMGERHFDEEEGEEGEEEEEKGTAMVLGEQEERGRRSGVRVYAVGMEGSE